MTQADLLNYTFPQSFTHVKLVKPNQQGASPLLLSISEQELNMVEHSEKWVWFYPSSISSMLRISKTFLQTSEEKKKLQETSSQLVPAPLNRAAAIAPTPRKKQISLTDGLTSCRDSPEPLYSSHSGMCFSILLR